MNTEHIRYFLEVVQCGSINKASEKLNINHQHLGRILTSLENELGAKLLERNRVGVTLTQHGIEILDLLKEIDTLNHQLKYYFNMNPKVKIKASTLKMYNFAMTNNARQNKFMMKIQNIMPNLAIEVKEACNDEIIEALLMNDVATMGTLCSFEDFPGLNLKLDNLPSNVEVVSETMGKIAMLVSVNNPLSDKYDTISIESLIEKPIVFYCPYAIENNHFYKIMNVYGNPYIKYKTANLHTFYDLLRNTECVAIGSTTTNLDAMFNPLFRKEEQLRMIPVRENIQFKIIRVVNELLKKERETVLREVIDRYFT